MRYSAQGAMKSRYTALISNCNRVVCFSRLLLSDESVLHSVLGTKMLVAGLGALMIDSDNFEKNNTSIYVTNGVGSRFFGNFNTNAGLLCSKIGNENKREFGAEWGICNFNTRIPGGPE
jgi:hypothetical protein